MKTFKNACAQGDVYVRRIDVIPASAKPAHPDGRGYFVVAHSETGHDHVVRAARNVQMFTSNDAMVSYLQVIEATEETEALLEHLRSFDTHKTIAIPPGVYELRRQRENAPEGWRQVAD